MKHPQYELYRAYLNTPEWKAIRMEIISVKKCCERCKSTYRLEVHHKSYRNLFNEGLNDLELLCNTCHKKEHNKPEKVKLKKGRKKQWASKVFKNLYAR
jgi:hypothetical protein